MIVGIHQPNFIPWCGFFYKIFLSDVFVLMDCVQYSKGSVINRVKIRSRNGWMWLTVPVLTKGKFGQEIRYVEVNDNYDWRRSHLNTLRTSYGKAAYFDEYYSIFENIYFEKSRKLSDINICFIRRIMGRLDMGAKKIIRLSELGVNGHGSDLVLNTVMALQGKCYLSGTGARDYNQEQDFAKSGIKLAYLDFVHPHYQQLNYGDFVQGLSVIDLLFNHGPEAMNIIRGQNMHFERSLRNICV